MIRVLVKVGVKKFPGQSVLGRIWAVSKVRANKCEVLREIWKGIAMPSIVWIKYHWLDSKKIGIN